MLIRTWKTYGNRITQCEFTVSSFQRGDKQGLIVQTAEGTSPAEQWRQEKQVVTGAGYPDQASHDVSWNEKCPPCSNRDPRDIPGMDENAFLVGPSNLWADTDIGIRATSLGYNGREKKQPRTSLFTSIKLHNLTSNLAAPLFYKQGRQMLWDPIQVSQQAHNRTRNRPFSDWQSII